MSTLIDEDIAHIGRVMPASMHGDFGGAILPAAYWRKRLFALLGRDHLSKPQLCAIDTLLLQLEHLDASELEPLPFFSNPANPAHHAAHNASHNAPRAVRSPTASPASTPCPARRAASR